MSARSGVSTPPRVMLPSVMPAWQLELNVDAWWWLIGLGVAAVAALVARRAIERLRRKRRARGALSAEHQAIRLLERRGYSVVERQVVCSWPVVIGELSVEVALRADYLVGRGGESFVAEVKKGAQVARIRHGPTRRQLLEYQLAYAVDGVLLVDVERQRVERVHFPRISAR